MTRIPFLIKTIQDLARWLLFYACKLSECASVKDLLRNVRCLHNMSAYRVASHIKFSVVCVKLLVCWFYCFHFLKSRDKSQCLGSLPCMYGVRYHFFFFSKPTVDWVSNGFISNQDRSQICALAQHWHSQLFKKLESNSLHTISISISSTLSHRSVKSAASASAYVLDW